MTVYLMLDQDQDASKAIVSFMKEQAVFVLSHRDDEKIIEHLQHLIDVMKGQYLTSDRTVSCYHIVRILHGVAAKHLEEYDYIKLMVVSRWIIEAQSEMNRENVQNDT
jgi:hypothetical protein